MNFRPIVISFVALFAVAVHAGEIVPPPSAQVTVMDRLQADLAMSGRRANAWADGDLATLMELAPSDESYAASFARSWPFLSDEEVARIIRNEDTRLAAGFERALNRNRTTFAALPLYLLTKRDGALSILAASGYRVERPEDRE